MLSKGLFLLLVAGISVQRLFELRISRRNEVDLFRKGAIEHAAKHFTLMKMLHLLWIFAMLFEVFFFDRVFVWAVALPAAIFAITGQILRYAAISTLKERWTVRIIVLPSAKPVTSGIFQFMRHPNYLGVVLEIFSIPLIHCAYLTSMFFTLLNAALLTHRIREEERALSKLNEYESHFEKIGCFGVKLK